MSAYVDFDALSRAQVVSDPYPHLILPGFIKTDKISAIESDYPKVELPGSLPLPTLHYGTNFDQFMKEIRGPQMSAIIGQKFGMDLSGHPTMVTVRGQCRATDGKIHTDSKTKLITVLIYMNGQWEEPGGRLRLLRSPTDLNDAFAEVPPVQGTLLVFKNQPNAWHGHESFEGARRAIQLNWVTDQGVVWREQFRHRVSAFFKRRSH
ncbi:MAG: 2OG-Fe(II) oxygenase [Alphaproteobacteria bacterium]|nr:2OG-Fe(II) oxygenase [Alphaproteobacteria bacterium]